jgi:hypothetical protein
MAEAVLTLSEALNRANSDAPITPTPDSKRCAQVRAGMSLATHTLARQRALKAAKAKLQAQGLRPSHFSHRDLVIRADAYLAEHREELIAEAREIVARWDREGFFGRRARLNIFDQRRKA